ncbi:erythromycin esterase-domain-containing protein [Aspergillus avenaceus]|uniref:Erythromycin esterase-domain-containing protein n=1 Tax=Aspergillus avenaceus TaxID=36643 RepID=A0A5N6TTE8_ASPAV|nr:erythromycin esterase-domain-containing protein [Aspergillus avenaceus]
MSQLQTLFTASAVPLPAIHDPSFSAHFDSFGHCRVVLLGDGSHGTSEFYSARAEITKRLITQHGYKMIAIEADWPDAEVIDRYVRQRPGPRAKIGGHAKPIDPFTRFPTWMWRNREMQTLVEWLRGYNTGMSYEERVGIYGLDMYSMGSSIREVTEYLDRVDPAAGRQARKRYGCLQPWVEGPSAYGLASLHGMEDCEEGVVRTLRELLEKRLVYARERHDGEEYLSSEQNAYLVRDAERYYKAMYYSSASSWTLRDTHMVDTLRRVLRQKAPETKAVVWAHNSHCGDARYTSMGSRNREVNIGQLCRERFGRENVALIGCGTHTGTVAAAHEWDEDMEVMHVRPSLENSWERVAHDTGIPSFVLDLRRDRIDPNLVAAFEDGPLRLERFIGVIYRPDTEKLSHYSAADLLNQFDAYVWFDETQAVKPLEKHEPSTALGAEETYPFGL